MPPRRSARIAARLAVPPAPLDANCYPTLIDLVFAFAPYDSLLRLRATCKNWRDRLDRQLMRHIVVDNLTEKVNGRIKVRVVVTTGGGRRIPRERWYSTSLIRYIQQLDVKGVDAGRAPSWMARVPRLRILRFLAEGVGYAEWPRPPADTHIIIDSPEPAMPPYRGRMVVVPYEGIAFWHADHFRFAPSTFTHSTFTVVFLPPSPDLAPNFNRYSECFKEMATTVGELCTRTPPVPVTIVNLDAWVPLQFLKPKYAYDDDVPRIFNGAPEFMQVVREQGPVDDDAVEFVTLDEWRTRVSADVLDAVESCHAA